MTDWQTKSSDVVYETPWIRVLKDEVIAQNGEQLTYSYMELQNPTVFIIATNSQKQILLQSVYRYPIRERNWEIPAGYMDAGEKPVDAARRELREEAGLTSNNWIQLGIIKQITGTGNVPVYIFLARDTQSAGEATDKDEDITERQFKSLEEIESMIVHGTLVDSPVIAALYMAKLHGL